MAGSLKSLSEWPVAVWVILLASATFAGEYLLLRIRQRRYRPRAEEAERRLTRFATALRHYARDNLQHLPGTLDELGLPEASSVQYRPVPRLNQDERLILVHDREPTHQVLEFPSLRVGRGVVFCSGRLHVVSEEVFEKLIAADNVLRERLGLEAGPAAPTERPERDRSSE